jgi:hypothetical protein
MPSAVKHGMSHRMCEPRNNSAEPRKGALGVRRRFCLLRWLTVVDGLLSNIDTKLGIWLPPFHWSWSGSESSESGVALRDREPVLHVCNWQTNKMYYFLIYFNNIHIVNFKVIVVIIKSIEFFSFYYSFVWWWIVTIFFKGMCGVLNVTIFIRYLNITKNIANIRLLSRISRSRPSTHRSI